jgi:hypothetical protein
MKITTDCAFSRRLPETAKTPVVLWSALVWLTAPLAASTAQAFSGGADAFPTCGTCHSTTSTPMPSVSIAGPLFAARGRDSEIFTLDVRRNSSVYVEAGLNLRSDAAGGVSFLAVSTGLVDIGFFELTHSSPRPMQGSVASFEFRLRTNPAATCNSTVTITGQALAADGNGGTTGDRAATATRSITILCPTITTTASPDVTLGSGQFISDTAVVTGRASFSLSPTVQFRLYGPDDADCSGVPAFVQVGLAYPAGGGPVTSFAFMPTAVGTYRWRASYVDGLLANSVAAPCNAPNESVVVSLPVPSLQISLGGVIVPDGSTTPFVPDITDYGTVYLGDPRTHVFRVRNTSGATATLIPDRHNLLGACANNFRLGALPGPLAPGEFESVDIAFEPIVAGECIATYRFYSNDPDNSPYDFQIRGNAASIGVFANGFE